MDLDFFSSHGANRLQSYPPQLPMEGVPEDADEAPEDVVLDWEVPAENWAPRPVESLHGWDVSTWPERPVRFVDGKDVGDTIVWLRAVEGYPVPVRLAEIGAVAVRVEDGRCHREAALVERVVAMYADAFPWDEVESLAAALNAQGFRLLPAHAPWDEAAQQHRPSFDFEVMRKAAQNRSNTEMGVMEKAVLALASSVPTVIDGRLEPRQGGFEQKTSPVAGVVKTHSKPFLHPKGMMMLYDLAPGERTPVFTLPKANLPVASWYVRLAGEGKAMPSWGVVRVEIALSWIESLSVAAALTYVGRLSRFLCEYRCHSSGYARAPVSLHPIVRGEQLLGALFSPHAALAQRFYRLTGL